MKKVLIAFVAFIGSLNVLAQDGNEITYQNSAEKLLIQNSALTIGGYGQVDYNQPINSDVYNNGKLDVHRLVMLFGYRFNERTQFVTELEFEHVKEVYVEQAFLQYKINNWLNFRGGLLLTPMGIINEYHEPTAYHGVERPLIDGHIAPTTWREIGFGFTGNLIGPALKYQVYMMNGFNGYDGEANFAGEKGFRSGRQKGAESFASAPNFTGKLEYYGIAGLNVGLSGYFGDSQTTLYDGIDKDNAAAVATADSSVVGISMIGVDARYTTGGLQLRGQLYYVSNSNTDQYNEFTGSDLGSAMFGHYVECAYNVLHAIDKFDSELTPFIRYSQYNTHQSVEDNIIANEAYDRNVITGGLEWKMAMGAVLKTDLQFVKTGADTEYTKVFSAGVGVMF